FPVTTMPGAKLPVRLPSSVRSIGSLLIQLAVELIVALEREVQNRRRKQDADEAKAQEGASQSKNGPDNEETPTGQPPIPQREDRWEQEKRRKEKEPEEGREEDVADARGRRHQQAQDGDDGAEPATQQGDEDDAQERQQRQSSRELIALLAVHRRQGRRHLR